MLDSNTSPSIPKRPQKKSESEAAEAFEAFGESDSECDNKQMASSDHLKSNKGSTERPTIPKGPENPISGIGSDKSNEFSDPTPESDKQIGLGQSDLDQENTRKPMIPKRPERPKLDSKSAETPLIPKRPQISATSSIEPSDLNDDNSLIVGENLPKIFTSNGENDTKYEDNLDSKLNSESSNKLVSHLDDDGEKTPGNSNTKINFKDDLGNANYDNASSASSFNDDLETFLQEKDFEEPCKSENETTILNTNDNADNIKSDEKNERENDKSDGNMNNHQKDSGECASSQVHDIQEREPTSKKTNSNNVEESGDAADDSTGKLASRNAPIIPKRPNKIKTPILDSDTKPENEQATEAINISETHKPTAIENSPSKHIPSQQENDIGSKPKAPPKPKKLSSKIAAFQQMFNQQTPMPSETTKYTQESEHERLRPESGEQEVNNGSTAPSKLSSDKMKFAQNLRGMMDKGVAMPGMVNPNLYQAKDNESSDESGSPEHNTISNIKKGVSKGPKGKRLPKSLKNPISVELKPRFDTVVLNLWEVGFHCSRQDNISIMGPEIQADNHELELNDDTRSKESLDISPESDIKAESSGESTDSSIHQTIDKKDVQEIHTSQQESNEETDIPSDKAEETIETVLKISREGSSGENLDTIKNSAPLETDSNVINASDSEA